MKSPVMFRSKSTGVQEEEEMEPGFTPVPETIWELFTLMKEQIKALATHGLPKPKAEVAWRLAFGEAFRTEGIKETIVFLAHVEHGFRVPTVDFFRELLYFCRIDLVHLVPNASPSSPPSSTCVRPT
jgi:hypothetical protein